MVRGEHLGRGVHSLVLVEKAANVARKLSVVRLPCGVQRIGSLFIGAAYLSPMDCAYGDERWQLILATGDGNGLLIGATVGVCDPAAPLGAQPRS